MIIGSDFDGVIADDTGARIAYIKERYGVVVTPEEIHGSKLQAKVGEKAKKEIEVEVNCSEKTLQFLPMPGVIEVFRKLYSEGDKIVIITGRTIEGVKWARKFMQLHGIPFHHIWSAKKISPVKEFSKLLGREISLSGKGRIANRVKPAVFVEDSDAHLSRLAPLKGVVKLFLMNRPYNLHVNLVGVERVSNWHDVYEHIQTLRLVSVR